MYVWYVSSCHVFFFFQAEDGIRDLVRSRGLGDVYKRQRLAGDIKLNEQFGIPYAAEWATQDDYADNPNNYSCLLYTSDAADERSSVDLGGRRIIKQKNTPIHTHHRAHIYETVTNKPAKQTYIQ